MLKNLKAKYRKIINKLKYDQPSVAVDAIIENSDGKILLIKRVNTPFGWALPGVFVEEGESLETAAMREALEETSLNVCLTKQLYTYSDPHRDPRKHTISTVYVAQKICNNEAVARDDASEVLWVRPIQIANFNSDITMVFDHKQIIVDYCNWKYNRKEVKIKMGEM